MARARPRSVLRHLAHRDRADRALLSRHGGRRGSAAVPRMRAPVAAALPRGVARYPPYPPRRRLRAGVLPEGAAQENARRHRTGVARLPARVLPPAAPELAQHRVAHAQSLVRERRASRPAPARADLIIAAFMKLLASLASPYTRKV